MTTLLDLCELIVDCEHKTAPLADSGYPSIRTPNVGRGRLILNGVNRVSEETYLAWSRRATPQAGDLIIAREAPLGNVAIIPQGVKVCLGQRTVLVRPDKSKVDPGYLCYFLLGDYAQGRFHGASIGATVPHLNMKDIRGLPIAELPSLSIQRRIASILSAYDDLIENNTRRIAILEEMARRLYEEWFVRFRFPGHEQVKVVESQLGLIPEGWKVCPLGEVSSINENVIRPASAPDEILYIDIASVAPGVITQKQPYRFSEAPGRARRVVRHGDVIWSCVRPNRRSYALVLQPEPTLVVSTGFAVLSAKSVPYSYLYFAISTDDFVGFLTNHATGVAYPAVTAATFGSAPFLKPDDEIVSQFHSITAPMLNMCEVLKRKIGNLRSTRDLLLPKLISGEIDVSSFPEPEGAHE